MATKFYAWTPGSGPNGVTQSGTTQIGTKAVEVGIELSKVNTESQVQQALKDIMAAIQQLHLPTS
jgi:hypothetical protein